MKRFSAFALVSAILAIAPGALTAEMGPRAVRQPRVVSRPSASGSQQATKVPGSVDLAGYSVQLNIVTRVQGLSFYKTAVDITNNTTSDGVTATFQYCFTLNGAFQDCTPGTTLTLPHFSNFHEDDIVDYIGSLGLLPPGAAELSFGTFIVTFANLPSNNGWEGTVTARTYSPIDQANPSAGTVAIAYPGSLFFESASGTLVGTIRDTRPEPTDAGALRTNLGVTNTALVDSVNPVSVQLSFYDVTEGSPTNGSRVGNVIAPPHALAAGEVYQFSDVFTLAAIPNGVLSCIVFVDVLSPPLSSSPTIEGYINILDGGTNDGAYSEMKCSVGCATF